MAIIKEGDEVWIFTKQRRGRVLEARYSRRQGGKYLVQYWSRDRYGHRGGTGPRGGYTTQVMPTERWYDWKQIERLDEAMGVNRK